MLQINVFHYIQALNSAMEFKLYIYISSGLCQTCLYTRFIFKPKNPRDWLASLKPFPSTGIRHRPSADFPVFNIFICIYGNDKNMAEKLNWTCVRGCPMSWTISMSVSRSLGGCPFRCVLFALQQSVGFVLYACPGGHLLLNPLHPSQPSLGLYRCRCYGWRWWCWWKRSPGTRTLFLTLKIKCFVIIVIWCMTSKAGKVGGKSFSTHRIAYVKLHLPRNLQAGPFGMFQILMSGTFNFNVLRTCVH